MRKLIEILFFFHLILMAALVIFLAVQGIPGGRNHFHPRKWYPPLLTSTICSVSLSLVWHYFAARCPSKAFKTAFWASPGLTFAVALLLLTVGSTPSLGAGIVVLISSIVMSLYGCWSSPRFKYAIRVLTVSQSLPPNPREGFFSITAVSVLVGSLYSCFLAIGIGGARARGTKLDGLFIVAMVTSLAWTLQVIRNTVFASISRVKFMFLVCGIEIDTYTAISDTVKHLMGSVCVGSILVPVLGLVWGSARAIKSASGDTDEFLFSCADCYSGVASALVTYASRWGFVHVGVYNKGFVQASKDVWEMFKKIGIEELIDSDLTGSFCFLSGVGLGAICSLVSGLWALAIHKSYATELSLYAFFIGYFQSRIVMAWQHASLAAYYVAYAENGNNPRFDSTIPSRIQELQRVQA